MPLKKTLHNIMHSMFSEKNYAYVVRRRFLFLKNINLDEYPLGRIKNIYYNYTASRRHRCSESNFFPQPLNTLNSL